MSTNPEDPGRQPTEEELRAYEAQLAQVRVEHILLDNVGMLITLGMRRTGLQPGTEAERDPAQVQLAIEAVRALMPQLEQIVPGEIAQIRNALSQLQLAYVRIGGRPRAEGAPAGQAGTTGPTGGEGARQGQPGSERSGAGQAGPSEPIRPGEPGPAQRSGRLWIPGQ